MNGLLLPSHIATFAPSAARRAPLATAAFLAVVGSLLLTVSAKVQVPFYPVPVTLQTLAVLLLGAAYGFRLGAATFALYLVQGFVGLPVFAGVAAGPAYFAGPTAGYLVGMLAAVALVGFAADRGWTRSSVKTGAAMLLGLLAIYGVGVTWLAAFLGAFDKAFAAGVMPFVYAEPTKLALAVALVAGVRSTAGRALRD